jgi:hypothetical protein
LAQRAPQDNAFYGTHLACGCAPPLKHVKGEIALHDFSLVSLPMALISFANSLFLKEEYYDVLGALFGYIFGSFSQI